MIELSLKSINSSNSFRLIFIFFITLFLIVFSCCNNNSDTIQISTKLISFINHSGFSEQEKKSKFKIIFFLDPSDFECPPCYSDLMKTIDTLRDNHSRSFAIRGYMLNQLNYFKDLDRFNKWKDVNTINFEIDFISIDEWFSFELKKSSIIVLSENKKILFFEIFPLGDEKFKELLNTISLK